MQNNIFEPDPPHFLIYSWRLVWAETAVTYTTAEIIIIIFFFQYFLLA